LEQFHSYYFWEIWGGTKEEAIQKVYDFHKTDYFKNIQPLEDAKIACTELKKNHELFVITSRQNDVIDATREWVDKYFPSIFSGIHFTNHFAQNGTSVTKKEICDNLAIDILIEDNLKFATECVTPKRHVLLFDYPWNQNSDLPKGIIRVYSWKEILEEIEKI